jgi:hypothetical protein
MMGITPVACWTAVTQVFISWARAAGDWPPLTSTSRTGGRSPGVSALTLPRNRFACARGFLARFEKLKGAPNHAGPLDAGVVAVKAGIEEQPVTDAREGEYAAGGRHLVPVHAPIVGTDVDALLPELAVDSESEGQQQGDPRPRPRRIGLPDPGA